MKANDFSLLRTLQSLGARLLEPTSKENKNRLTDLDRAWQIWTALSSLKRMNLYESIWICCSRVFYIVLPHSKCQEWRPASIWHWMLQIWKLDTAICILTACTVLCWEWVLGDELQHGYMFTVHTWCPIASRWTKLVFCFRQDIPSAFTRGSVPTLMDPWHQGWRPENHEELPL